jgi:hypothetical protein
MLMIYLLLALRAPTNISRAFVKPWRNRDHRSIEFDSHTVRQTHGQLEWPVDDSEMAAGCVLTCFRTPPRPGAGITNP